MVSRLVLKVERVKVLKVRTGVKVGDLGPSNGPCGGPRNPIDQAPILLPPVLTPVAIDNANSY